MEHTTLGAGGDEASALERELVAYSINPALRMRLVRAEAVRPWMDTTDARFANRCLPLLVANQAGWIVESAHTLRAVWTGGNGAGSVQIEYLTGDPPYPAASHFGHGILTWSLPYVFRTTPGYNLLVRGPANVIKDGAQALEGIVETDWWIAPFTANWKLTRANHPVRFEAGEPICMLVPQRRGELESFRPEVRRLEADPGVHARYADWAERRTQFLAELRVPDSSAANEGWQKHYFSGLRPDGDPAHEHQAELRLRDFVVSDLELQNAFEESPGAPADSAENEMLGGVESAPTGACAAAEPANQPADEVRAPKQQAPSSTGWSPATRRDRLPSADEVLRELIVIEHFMDDATCQCLIEMHQRFRSIEGQSQNGLPVLEMQTLDPQGFQAARQAVQSIARAIAESFHQKVGCDLALICALTTGYRHVVHADNSTIACPRHGSDPETLIRARCDCADATVAPNHTPWRKYTGLLYLSEAHAGGSIVFGPGPSVWGKIYRKEIHVRCGLLVLSPSNELYFHQTTPLKSGVRYSLNCWFTDDRSHTRREFEVP